jgi:hypothetical protein
LEGGTDLSIIFEKLKEVLLSVIPVFFIVLVLHFFIIPIPEPVLFRFLIGSVLIIVGLTIFLLGVDLGISPIGASLGVAIIKRNHIAYVLGAGLVLGFFISIAEPDLHILAEQVDGVSSGAIPKLGLVVVVSVGIAVMIAIGLTRIVYNFPLYKLLMILYPGVFLLALFTSREFLAISFDASGATTGALTVPFILAMAIGVSRLKKNSKSSEKDSFGLVAIASVGPILAIMAMSLITGTHQVTGTLPDASKSLQVISPFLHEFPIVAGEILLALAPILIIFVVANKRSSLVSRRSFRRIMFGVLLTFAGLVVFLVGVFAGFMDMGSEIGMRIASMENKNYVVILGFVLGFVTILAEPAVHVLTRQIEDVTSGYVNRKMVLLFLSIGVGTAVALSMVRILTPDLELWQYLLPGYAICLGLMFFVPKMFVGMAFDSGGVASGPMTATFVLSYSQGAAESVESADVLIDGFGIIAMVAMTPIISLQILGLIYKIKTKKGGLDRHVD